MASDRFELKALIPATPEAVYRAWLTGREHTRMTGVAATGAPKVGARFSAWDGYIEGRNLELEPGKRILQSWRSTEFPEDAPDSRLEVLLSAVKGAKGGTRLVLRHSEIPKGQGKSYRSGWVEHYFEPMEKYFGAPAKAAKAAPARTPAKKKKAATASRRAAVARGDDRR